MKMSRPNVEQPAECHGKEGETGLAGCGADEYREDEAATNLR